MKSFQHQEKENKLLEVINDRTVIEETVTKFLYFKEIDEIIIASNLSIINELKNLFQNPKIKITEGGNTRQKSVYNALQQVENDYVLIHDGARPLINNDTIEKVLINVVEKSAVSVMAKTTDTIKEVNEAGQIIRTIDRSKLYNTQTPQAFKTDIIVPE